jgi:hypothetical protein
MPTPRKPTATTAEAIDQFCACFDALFPNGRSGKPSASISLDSCCRENTTKHWSSWRLSCLGPTPTVASLHA